MSPNAGGNTTRRCLLPPGKLSYQGQPRANPEAELNPGRTPGQHVQVPTGDVQSNTDTDPGVAGQARAHVQRGSANSAPDLIEPVSQAHFEEMARLILQRIHEIGKEPLAVPEPQQAGARAPSFLEDGVS